MRKEGGNGDVTSSVDPSDLSKPGYTSQRSEENHHNTPEQVQTDRPNRPGGSVCRVRQMKRGATDED